MSGRATISEEDQIVFLLSCVRHANAGVVNFNNVVKECQIVSVGAASKRFSRLNQKYTVSGNIVAATGNDNGSAESPAQTKPARKPTTPKKSNVGGKAASKAEKTPKKTPPATAPLAAGIIKKRPTPVKNSQFTTALEDVPFFKEEEGPNEEDLSDEEMTAFFNAEMAPYLGEGAKDEGTM